MVQTHAPNAAPNVPSTARPTIEDRIPAADPRITHYRNLRKSDESDIARLADGSRALVNILVAHGPLIDSGGAIFRGVYSGFSVIADIGMVMGRDTHDLYNMTFYTRFGIRIWAETYESDNFMDSAAYIRFSADRDVPVTVGGIVDQKGVTELKMEYLLIAGPDNRYEERLLIAERPLSGPRQLLRRICTLFHQQDTNPVFP